MAKTILIVEDHAPMRAALGELLLLAYPQAGILQAASGARAIELVRNHAPQLVLLDVSLPDANGIHLIPQIRALAPACIVVVVSQHSAPAYLERALAAGASAYVTKDALSRELLPALERALDAGAA